MRETEVSHGKEKNLLQNLLCHKEKHLKEQTEDLSKNFKNRNTNVSSSDLYWLTLFCFLLFLYHMSMLNSVQLVH